MKVGVNIWKYIHRIWFSRMTKGSKHISVVLLYLQAYFNSPEGDEPLAIDMEGMGKGQIWVNGQSIGRYWTAYATGKCDGCSYAGTFRPPKCQLGCGQPTQRW